MRPSRGAATARSHRADIQGRRALAVLLVALGHAGVPAFRGGFVGVDVFFVDCGEQRDVEPRLSRRSNVAWSRLARRTLWEGTDGEPAAYSYVFPEGTGGIGADCRVLPRRPASVRCARRRRSFDRNQVVDP